MTNDQARRRIAALLSDVGQDGDIIETSKPMKSTLPPDVQYFNFCMGGDGSIPKARKQTIVLPTEAALKIKEDQGVRARCWYSGVSFELGKVQAAMARPIIPLADMRPGMDPEVYREVCGHYDGIPPKLVLFNLRRAANSDHAGLVYTARSWTPTLRMIFADPTVGEEVVRRLKRRYNPDRAEHLRVAWVLCSNSARTWGAPTNAATRQGNPTAAKMDAAGLKRAVARQLPHRDWDFLRNSGDLNLSYFLNYGFSPRELLGIYRSILSRKHDRQFMERTRIWLIQVVNQTSRPAAGMPGYREFDIHYIRVGPMASHARASTTIARAYTTVNGEHSPGNLNATLRNTLEGAHWYAGHQVLHGRQTIRT